MGTDVYVMSSAMLKTLIDETFQIPDFNYETVKNIVNETDIYEGSHAGKQITVIKSPNSIDLFIK